MVRKTQNHKGKKAKWISSSSDESDAGPSSPLIHHQSDKRIKIERMSSSSSDTSDAGPSGNRNLNTSRPSPENRNSSTVRKSVRPPPKPKGGTKSPRKGNKRVPVPIRASYDYNFTRSERNAILEIQRYQKTTMNLIPRLPFRRLVKEITIKVTNCTSLKYYESALRALQEAAEAYLVRGFQDANRCAIHAHRKTIRRVDMNLVEFIKNV